jgi:hypothetical protein
MGKIIVTLTILFLIFLFFQGFTVLEDFLAGGEGSRHTQPAVLGILPWSLIEPMQVTALAVAVT